LVSVESSEDGSEFVFARFVKVTASLKTVILAIPCRSYSKTPLSKKLK
jgi:hypothetical protein